MHRDKSSMESLSRRGAEVANMVRRLLSGLLTSDSLETSLNLLG